MIKDWRSHKIIYDKDGGEEVSSEQLRDMIDRCYPLGRDYMREFELVKRAWTIRRRLAFRAPEEV